jgi:branched-chain amino acid transport system ATP-binding protein
VRSWFPALEGLADRRAGLLSGGEQQMLALARALFTQPRLLLVDELSLGLAPAVVADLLPTLRDVARQRGVGIVLVEQHVDLALSVADRALVLGRHTVVASGTPAEIATQRQVIEASYLGNGGPGVSPPSPG